MPVSSRSELAAAGAAGCGTLALGAANGGFFPLSWSIGALVAAWIVAVALVLGDVRSPGRWSGTLLGAFVALETWTGLSAIWSRSLPSSYFEAERGLLYALVVAAAVLVGRRVRVEALAAGVLAGIAALCVWDLARGGGSLDPAHQAPPLGYANGLGLLAAIGCVLALGAASAGRPIALLLLGLFVPVLVLQHSTGSDAALVAGALLLVVLRLRLRTAAVALAVAVVVAAFALAAWAESRGHERGHDWSVAARAVDERPALGSGAGTFFLTWLRLRRTPITTQDAHSLYLETLDELGPVGLVLVLAAIALPLAAAVRARSDPAVAPAGAAYGVYALGAGVDFHWELAGVTVPALLLGAAVTRAADAGRPELALRPRLAAVALAVAAGVVAALMLAGTAPLATAGDELARGHDAAATHAAARATRWAPWASQAWERLGLARLAAGDRAGARAALAEAVRRDPYDSQLLLELAQASNGEPRRRALARAARLNPLYFSFG